MLSTSFRSVLLRQPNSDPEPDMPSTSKLKTSIGRALRGCTDASRQPVHFHLSSDGRPFLCDVDRCESAALTLGDLRTLHQDAR
jgi:hypothetical protein